MTQPSLEDARTLSEWRPPLGVLSVYLGFDPADRGGAWRTELRNALDAILEEQKEAEHDRRVALRATAKRLTERFEDGELRPPPRGEAGFVEVSDKAATEHWFGTGVAPVASACADFGQEPVVAPLLDLCGRGAGRAVAVLSAERVRLLRSTETALEELEDWELSITSLDWREQGDDQFGERLDHNRQRFLGECGSRVAHRLEGDGLEEAIVFGPAPDVEGFSAGFNSSRAKLTVGGDADLISVPRGQLTEVVADAVRRLDEERERAVVERALEEAMGGSRGAVGLQETKEALAEGRVDHLVLASSLGEEAESLIRAALAGSARLTIVHDEVAGRLSEAEGVAAILRY
jgi:Bacterial archaeo-eukaryotic release factor family 10